MNEQEIGQLIEKLNTQRNVSFVQSAEKSMQYSGVVRVNELLNCKIVIEFPNSFPLKLPEITVIAPQKRFAHMGMDGKLCLLDKSSILIDTSMPEQVLMDSFDQAFRILSIDCKSAMYSNELLREFDSYWLSISDFKMYSAIEEQGMGYKELPLFISGKSHIVASALSDAKYYACNYLNCKDNENAFSTKCIVISLRKGTNPIELKKTYRWKDVKRYILDNVSESIKRRFRTFLNCSAQKMIKYIVLSLPGEFGNVLFGFKVHFYNHKKEKIEKIVNARIDQVYIQRIDKKYMLQRSGIEFDFSKKQILILGCGSVGGYIANNMCQIGVGALDLLDDDFFSKENVYRHFLGFDSLTKSSNFKAVLLKERLEQMYPYTDIDSLDYIDRSVESFLSHKERLGNYDLIISALGEPTLNLEINRILYECSIATPFVCCFNEPYGIGGHAMVVNMSRESCLRCLYTDIISSSLVAFRPSFVKPNQYFKKNISGCSSAFVPYNCLDSQETSLITSRLAISILKGEVNHNEVYSWIGDDSLLKKEGYISSDFFENKKNIGHINKMVLPPAKYCPICHKK